MPAKAPLAAAVVEETPPATEAAAELEALPFVPEVDDDDDDDGAPPRNEPGLEPPPTPPLEADVVPLPTIPTPRGQLPEGEALGCGGGAGVVTRPVVAPLRLEAPPLPTPDAPPVLSPPARDELEVVSCCCRRCCCCAPPLLPARRAAAADDDDDSKALRRAHLDIALAALPSAPSPSSSPSFVDRRNLWL